MRAFFLLFTSAISEPSAQDISLGFDMYYVMTPDQCTAYGEGIDEMSEVLAKVLAFGREEARPRLTGFSV
ncbi:hypothetical protein ABZ349_03600 [Streptomyces niveus]|uniref:hypothetical protein n=1 Tax=Streptomyces niveus TaxID=193462 RepID=UPI0033F1A126